MVERMVERSKYEMLLITHDIWFCLKRAPCGIVTSFVDDARSPASSRYIVITTLRCNNVTLRYVTL